MLLSAFPDTGTRRVKTSPAQETEELSVRKLLLIPKGLRGVGGSRWLVSFPGSSASLGIQLHAREVTLDLPPPPPSPAPKWVKTLMPAQGAGSVGSPPSSPRFSTISLIPLRLSSLLFQSHHIHIQTPEVSPASQFWGPQTPPSPLHFVIF